MWDTIHNQWSARIAVVLFIFFSIWWVILQFMHLPQDSDYNQLWAALYGIVAFWGGLCGLLISRKWGGIHSIMGKSILLFSLGLLSQEVGQIAYSYYIYFLHQPLPYPSIGDYFFWATVPLYIMAVIYLAQASGVHISLRSVKGKLQAVIIPAIILIFSYAVFLQGYEFDWSNIVKILIDFGVPVGEAIYISLAILTYILTRGLLGGVMKSKVLFMLLALLSEYVADWTFLYQASRNIWYAGGVNDYMYFVAYFLMTLSLIQLGTVLESIEVDK
jgi:hypothetical protein